MTYKITEKKRQVLINGNVHNYIDLVLTFKNGKRWVLVPLCRNDSKASRCYFYALLEGVARK